jgi:hypothetical protein
LPRAGTTKPLSGPGIATIFATRPTRDELLEKIAAMALDLLPDNHPEVDPVSLYIQITALREAEPAAA